MMQCGCFARAKDCCATSTPPTIHTHLNPMALPNASKTSWICTASSLVGARTVPNNRDGFSSNLCMMGNPNAPVFPLPSLRQADHISTCQCHGNGLPLDARRFAPTHRGRGVDERRVQA